MTKLFEHLWIKLIALVLGLMLWFHVATEKVYNYELNLPISDIVLDSGLTLAEKPPDSLLVTVSATGKQLMRKKWRGRGLKIIANQYKAGQHDFVLNTTNTFITTPISNVILDDVIFPANITLMIDHLVQKVTKVQPKIIIEPGEGFAVGMISSPRPNEIMLIGPRSIVRNISTVYTQERELQGLRDNIELTLPIEIPEGYGLYVNPDSVRVLIEIVPVKTRVFDNIPIVVYNLPAGENLLPRPSVLSIELTGSPGEIDLINKNALIASADYKLLSDSGYVPVKIDCPVMFKVKNSSIDSVTFISEL